VPEETVSEEFLGVAGLGRPMPHCTMPDHPVNPVRSIHTCCAWLPTHVHCPAPAGAHSPKASLMPTFRGALPTKTVRGLLSASWRIGEMLTKVVADYGIVTKLAGLPAFGGVLEGFPLVHEVTDLPHERVVLRHNCICNFPIVIETGG